MVNLLSENKAQVNRKIKKRTKDRHFYSFFFFFCLLTNTCFFFLSFFCFFFLLYIGSSSGGGSDAIRITLISNEPKSCTMKPMQKRLPETMTVRQVKLIAQRKFKSLRADDMYV